VKRLLWYAAFLLLGIVAGLCFWFFRPTPEPPEPPPSVSVVETNAVVKELPLHKGDPLTLRLETPRSKWKAVTILPLQQGNTQPLPPLIDMGLAYEVLTLQPKLGPVKLPDLTLDAVLTPNRYGLGGSIPITEHVDLEAGLSRRWDAKETERYLGVGFHIAF
jgi:hypothetical protein